MLTADDFRDEVEAFLSRTGMAPSVFGAKAVRDPNFVFDLREGRAPSLRMVERVARFIEQHAGRAA